MIPIPCIPKNPSSWAKARRPAHAPVLSATDAAECFGVDPQVIYAALRHDPTAPKAIITKSTGSKARLYNAAAMRAWWAGRP